MLRVRLPHLSHCTSAPAASNGSAADTDQKVQELNTRLTKLKLTIEGLEKERNFYFGSVSVATCIMCPHPLCALTRPLSIQL